MLVETELDEILDLSKKNINELLEERRKIASKMNGCFRKKNPNWPEFYEGNEQCIKIDYAIYFKPENEKEDYLAYSEELKQWAVRTERYHYAADRRDRIREFKRYLTKESVTQTIRQTL